MFTMQNKVNVRIKCPGCNGKGTIYVSTEWQTSSGHDIKCYTCKGEKTVITQGELVDA